MSHNTRTLSGTTEDERTGNMYQNWDEEQVGEIYYATLLDSRSCAQAQQGQTIADLFARYGVQVIPSCGQHNRQQLPRLKDMFKVDYQRDHLTRKNPDGTPFRGAPSLYMFESCSKFPVLEIESLHMDTNNPSLIKAKQDDHWIDTAKYFASDNPRFMGDCDNEDSDDNSEEKIGLAKRTIPTAY